MKKRIIYLIVCFVVIVIANTFIMPNHEYWINRFDIHIIFAKSMLFIDIVFIGVILPTEIAKISYRKNKLIK